MSIIRKTVIWHKTFSYMVHTVNGPFFRNTQVSRYQEGKTNLDFTGARDSEWQWHQVDHMQVCTSLQTDNHASTQPLSFLQAGCPSCRPANSVKALKAIILPGTVYYTMLISPGAAAPLLNPCMLSHVQSTLLVVQPVDLLDYLSITWLGSRVVSVLDSGAEGPGSNRSRDAVG